MEGRGGTSTTAMKDVDLDVDVEGGKRQAGAEDSPADATANASLAGTTSAARASSSSSGVMSPPIFDRAAEERPGMGLEGDEQEGDLEAGGALGGRQRPPDDMAIGGAMDGVGEDEKAYNYICNLDKVNLGGPGWFNDVFRVSVQIHTDRTWMDTLALSLVPRHIFQRHCALLDTSRPVTGKVTVEAPTSKKVWMAGLTVTFEEHLLTVDTDGGELVGALEAKVAVGQFIDGKATFGFSLDLRLLESHRGWAVRETYVGDLMALRHRILVTAQRPWYTFNVYHQVPLAMECLSDAPETDAGPDNEEGGPNHLLIISDCNGRCEFDFGVDSFHLDDIFKGIVRFTGITNPVVAAHVMFLRAEFMYGEASETLVAEHTILGTKREKKEGPAVQAGASQEEMLQAQLMSPYVDQRHIHFVHTQEEDCRVEEVIGDAQLSVRIPLQALPLTPSHMSLTQDISLVNDEAELVCVRYYIRLILEDNTGTAYWHTHELFFHRADLSTSSTEIGGHLDPDDPHNDYLGEDSDDAEGTDYTRYSTTTHEDRIDNAVLRDEGETTQIATDAVAPTEAQMATPREQSPAANGDNQEQLNGQHGDAGGRAVES